MNEGLKFQIIKEDGTPVECEIITIMPNSEDETSPYIAYTDFDTSNGYKILCGQLVEGEDGYTINKIEDEVIIDELKSLLADKMIEVADKYKEVSESE